MDMVPSNGRHFSLPIIVVAAFKADCGAANLAAAHPQFHPGWDRRRNIVEVA